MKPMLKSCAHCLAASAIALTLAGACQKPEDPTTVPSEEQWKEIRSHLLETAPSPQYKIEAKFEDTIELIGLDVSEPLVAGQEATFTWYWRALKDVPQNWQVFVHFDSQVRPLRQNLDHHPVGGLYQTSRWKKGQIVRDVQKVTMRGDFPAGKAIPYVGFFRANTRMEVSNDASKTDDRRVIGPTLTVQGAAGKAPSAGALPRYPVKTLAPEQLEAFQLDGKPDEKLWEEIPVFKLAAFDQGEQETVVKAFWTPEHLYLSAILKDGHIWATLKERDARLWTEEVLEFFLAPGGPEGPYLELQINPAGAVFDARFEARLGRGEGSREEQIARAQAFNIEGLESAVHVDGTLGEEGDQDQQWSVEIRIPLGQIPGREGGINSGEIWRVNAYRFDRPAPGTTHAYGWATGPRQDFHQIEQFGEWHFGAGGRAAVRPTIPPEILQHIQKRLNTRQIQEKLEQQNGKIAPVPAPQGSATP